MRIGYGYDAHRLKAGRACILCGVPIPCDFGPDGHSDADAPLHALMDALFGAAALGDIGRHFPDADGRFLGADSAELLKTAYGMLRARGYTLSNADITVVLQAPKLAPYIEKMRENIAAALECDVGRISVKATTEEKMGFTGDGTGVSASAVVLLE
ncbi:MAG: 2-C-methyl-D-erythritol 2,4-cyclodiphosphate synthase [Oscillospiraceae bacterium]|nr:2-C-methyl-D-erythritol 2,4-cyclodiphosphate synthase [Oscillospiraceae bacterium]